MKKYELTTNTKEFYGKILYQIKALKDFADVKSGDLGGWIESEYNLSQKGNCWVYGNAKVYGYAQVFENAKVYGYAQVFENAKVYGNAWVYTGAIKRGEYGKTPLSIPRSDGYVFTLQSDGSIVAGCRDFTPEQADAHWNNPDHHKHKESWAIVKALRAISKAQTDTATGALRE